MPDLPLPELSLPGTPPYRRSLLATPLGPLLCIVDGGGALVGLDFQVPGGMTAAEQQLRRRGLPAVDEASPPDAVAGQLADYFAGRRRAFDLPLAPFGTPFQHAVWAALLDLPCGSVSSYAAMAARLGRPAAIRAVGRANATNPIAIVIPCHRLIGSDGSLTGYAGGLERKAALLRLEGAAIPARRA